MTDENIITQLEVVEAGKVKGKGFMCRNGKFGAATVPQGQEFDNTEYEIFANKVCAPDDEYPPFPTFIDHVTVNVKDGNVTGEVVCATGRVGSLSSVDSEADISVKEIVKMLNDYTGLAETGCTAEWLKEVLPPLPTPAPHDKVKPQITI